MDTESMEQATSGDASAAAADQDVEAAAVDQTDEPTGLSDPSKPAETEEGDGEKSKPSSEHEKTGGDACDIPKPSHLQVAKSAKDDAGQTSASSPVEMKTTEGSKDTEEDSGQTSESPMETETPDETKKTKDVAKSPSESETAGGTRRASASSSELDSRGQNEEDSGEASKPPSELKTPEEAGANLPSLSGSPTPEKEEGDASRTAKAPVESEMPEAAPQSSGVDRGSSGELEDPVLAEKSADVNSGSPSLSGTQEKTAEKAGENVRSPENSEAPVQAAENLAVNSESSVSETPREAEETAHLSPDSPSKSGTAEPLAKDSVTDSACPVLGETSEASPCRQEDKPGVAKSGELSSGTECLGGTSANMVTEESMPVLEKEEPLPEEAEVNAAGSETVMEDEAPSLEEKRDLAGDGGGDKGHGSPAGDGGGDKGHGSPTGDTSCTDAEKPVEENAGEVNFVISDVCTTQQFENGDDHAEKTAEGGSEVKFLIQDVCTAEGKDLQKAKVTPAPVEVIDLSDDETDIQKNAGKSGTIVNNNSAEDSSSSNREPSGNGKESSSEDVEMKEDGRDDSGDKVALSQSKSGDKESSASSAAREEEKMDTSTASSCPGEEDDDNDVIILDDKDTMEAIDVDALDIPDATPAVTMDPNNDMGLQITSVHGGADINKIAVKMESSAPKKRGRPAKNSSGSNQQSSGCFSRIRNCLVCSKLLRCKYNIMHNGTARHLCDNACFKAFRAKPAMYLGAGTNNSTASAEPRRMGPSGPVGSAPQPSVFIPRVRAPPPLRPLAPAPLRPAQEPSQAPVVGQVGQMIKTCRVCEVMNISAGATKTFLNWQGFDFCSDACLGKFQQMLGSSCFMCKSRLKPQENTMHCIKAGQEMRIFCSQNCQNAFNTKMTCCANCKKDLSGVPDSFSAPIGPQSHFKEFCSQDCMKQFEKNTAPGQVAPKHCAVCNRIPAVPDKFHTSQVKMKGALFIICSVPCLDAFKFTQNVELSRCDHCSIMCTQDEAQQHFIQFEGQQHFFCSDTCVGLFRQRNRKAVVCAFCNARRQNFDMIERVDANSSFQLFCSLNCLSLYRVNLQAKSNQAVSCDQCRKRVPAQYHLTMSDASVRNFCSYGCVVAYQAQFSKMPVTVAAAPQQTQTRGNITPRQSARQAAKAASSQTSSSSSQKPSFPVISNVVSLAPQQATPQQPTVNLNIQTSTAIPIVPKPPAGQTVQTVGPVVQKTTGSQATPVQQQIIVQPPAPKVTRNKSLLCKPFVQTKATSCRPLATSKACQTDETGPQTVLIPVPVPIYVPIPLPMYAAPTPHPFPIPIPVPVPIFIPTTKKSADGILRHIKEISEKIPTDPLEAEMLMMAEAVAEHKDSSSDSESDNELPPISFGEKAEEERVVGGSGTGKIEGAPVEEEDMLQMAMRMAEEMTDPMDLEAAVDPIPINTEPPPPRVHVEEEEDYIPVPESRKRTVRRQTRSRTRSSKRQRMEPEMPAPEPTPPPPAIVAPPQPPADASCYLKFTFGVRAWRQWVVQMNAKLEGASKRGSGRLKLFKTDLLQCTADELNYSLCLFVKEIRKPNGEEYSPDSIYYLCLGIQQYLFENGRIDNIFTDIYYEKFTSCLNEILVHYEPKLNAQGQMACRIEEEHLWECKQLGAHSPHVLLNTLVYFNTRHFMLKTPEEHLKLSFAHILKHWRRGTPGRGLSTPNTNASTPSRSVSLRFYCLTPNPKSKDAKKPKEGIPVYETQENTDNPLRCPVKLYEFFLSKCPESVKSRNDMFYLVPERSCVPDSPVWYSTQPIGTDAMAKMLNRIMLVREIQEAHLHPQPIYV